MSQDAAIEIALRLLDQATAPYAQAMAKVQRDTSATEQYMRRLDGAASTLKRTLATVGVGLGVREIVQTADQYQNLHGRLRLVTSSTAELMAVEKSLYGVAQESRVGYAETVDLHARLSRASKDLGISQQQMLVVTDAINKSMIVSGATATEASAAMIQLSQGIASGTLRGDELRSVLEQTPRLAQAIADGMGVSVGQLRELGREGKLTGEAVVKALISQSEVINREFGQMPKTIGQAGVVFNNTLGKLISGTDRAGGLSSILAGKIIDLSKSIDGWAESNRVLLQYDVPEYINKTGEAIRQIVSIKDIIPDGVLGPAGMGLVGWYLFGGTAGKLIFVLTTLNEQLERYQLNIGSFYDNSSRLKDVWDATKQGKSYYDYKAEQDALAAKARIDRVFGGVDTASVHGAKSAQFFNKSHSGAYWQPKPPPLPDEAEAKKARQYAEQLANAQREWGQKAEVAGLSGVDEQMRKIGQEADELREKFKKGDQSWIDRGQEAQEYAAIQTDSLARAKKAQEEWDKVVLSGLTGQEQAVAKVRAEFDGYRQTLVESAAELGKPIDEVISQLDALGRAEAEAVEHAKNKTSELTEFQKQAYRSMEQYGANFFESLRTGQGDMLDNWIDTMGRMVDEYASAQLMMAAFGSDFGKGGKLGGFIGAAVDGLMAGFGGGASASASSGSGGFTYESQYFGSFGGARAGGGPVWPGMFYEVNEREPELLSTGGRTYLMMGSDGGRVTPPATNGAASPATQPAQQQVSITIIAADAKSFADMAKRNPEAIIGPLRMAMQGGDRGLRSDMRAFVS